jgi:hypothetical protein
MMSNAKLFIQDWRNAPTPLGAAWATMSPAPAFCSVSPTWGNTGFQTRPRSDTPTLVGCAMALSFYNGIATGVTGDPLHDMNVQAVALGYDMFPMRRADGTIVQDRLYNTNPTSNGNPSASCMLNVSRGDVGRWLAAFMANRQAWSDGWHVDYWTNLDWLWPDTFNLNPGYVGVGPADGSFWNSSWMRGANRCIHEYRRLRTLAGKSSIVIGQQWHNSIDNELDGRFVEVDPDNWGTDPWQTYHQAQFDAFPATALPHAGSKAKMVVELRVPASATTQKKTDVVAFCSTNTCYCSWGIQDTAGVGWPG